MSFSYRAVDEHGATSADKVVSLTVTGANDSPSFGSATEVVEVDEDIDPTAVVYEADAIDVDGDSLTYSVTGPDSDQVTIDLIDGQVRFNESPDYESGKTVRVHGGRLRR